MNVADFRDNLVAVDELIYFDKNEYLREKTSHPLIISEFIEQGKNLLKTSNEEDTYFLHGVLGNLYRINGQSKEAINCLSYCLNFAVEERNHTREIVSLIRLGEALKYDNNHSEALYKFNEALRVCEVEKIDEFLDFALQHKGKCLMELARLKTAEDCFLNALELRNKKGNSSLIKSTQQAITLVNELQLIKNNNKNFLSRPSIEETLIGE